MTQPENTQRALAPGKPRASATARPVVTSGAQVGKTLLPVDNDRYVVEFWYMAHGSLTGPTTYDGYGIVDGRAGLREVLGECGKDAIQIRVTRLNTADNIARDWTEDALTMWADDVQAEIDSRPAGCVAPLPTIPPVLADLVETPPDPLSEDDYRNETRRDAAMDGWAAE